LLAAVEGFEVEQIGGDNFDELAGEIGEVSTVRGLPGNIGVQLLGSPS
jgi:hypothetical protein